MSTNPRNSELEASQSKSLPLIINVALGVQILSSVRDFIIMGLDLPISLQLLNLLLIALMMALNVWTRVKVISTQLGTKLIFIAIISVGAKAIASTVLLEMPSPLYMAILMFAISLCFLSKKCFLIATGTIALTWTIVAANTLSTSDLVPSVLAMALGAILGIEMLHKRIQSAIQVFELKRRVEKLKSILPMCASCKKTRDETGNWHSIEQYLATQHAGLQVSHSLCPTCLDGYYEQLSA